LREEFHETGKKLRTLSPERVGCLDAVMESKDFIDWLRDAIPGNISKIELNYLNNEF